MDPVGFAIGVIGLYSTCRDCYLFFSNVKNAEKNLLIKIRDFDIQASSLHAWGFYWEVHPPDGRENSQKLQDYLSKNPYKRNGVVKTLAAIGDTMSSESLLKQYGIKLEIKDGDKQGKDPKTSAFELPPTYETEKVSDLKQWKGIFNQRLSLLRKCKWSLKHSNDFVQLTSTLSSYNSQLYQFCPEGAYETMNLYRTVYYLDGHNSPKGLERSSQAAHRLAQEDQPMQEGLKQLGDMMDIKGNAGFHNANPITDRERDNLLRFDQDNLYLRSPTLRSTLAVWTEDEGKSTVYVEFKSYMDDRDQKNEEMHDGILRLGRLMCNPNAPSRLRTMKCLGLFDNSYSAKIGLVFEIPGSPRPTPAHPIEDQWDFSQPQNLLSLLSEDQEQPFSLGWRFDLAKKLVENVILLHACGWLHKNIRSTSVIFFPRSSTPGHQVDTDIIDLDYSKPFLMGYDYIRSDTAPKPADQPRLQLYRLEITTKPADQLEITTNRRAITRGPDDRPDIYHHPSKRSAPHLSYLYAHDIYSLGILLLEIGLWDHLTSLVDDPHDLEPFELRSLILSDLQPKLISSCGEIYTSVVVTFLNMESKSGADSVKRQRETCVKMAGELARCVA